MADANPANFANLSKERVQEIASMGGKASHGNDTNGTDSDTHAKELAKVGRNEDGTFQKSSKAASEAGHIGGLHSHDNDGKKEDEDSGRRADGTFTKGSDAAKEAGHIGGLHAHGKEAEEEKKENGRREDGTFLPNSEAAKEAGHKGGLAAAANN